MRNIILRGLNTENISNSLFFKELYILGTFEIRSNKDIFSNVGNSKLIEGVFVVDLNISIGIPGSYSVGTIISLLLYVNSSGITFDFNFSGFFHEEILKTFPSFIEIKCKRINSFILWEWFELLFRFFIFTQVSLRSGNYDSFHSVIYLPAT